VTSANRRTPRVQGGGDAAPGMPGGIAQHREKVAAGEVQCGGAPIWWKKCTDRKDVARWCGGDLLEVGEMRRSN
jgi:hypothetical protein